jgi:hypothetical protein
MASKSAFRDVPETINLWRAACKKAGVQRQSVNSFVGMCSGSKITQEQYLLLRVICPQPKNIAAFNPATYNLAQESVAAATLLTGLPDFQTFLLSIRLNSRVVPGIFAIPRMNQLLMKPAAPAPAAPAMNNPPARNLRSAAVTTGGSQQLDNFDEEVVNVCLITYLQALAGAIPTATSEWTPERFVFETRFAKDRYEAQIDGYLRVQGASKKVQAIVEAKRERRRCHRRQLEMQEAAEMVGWIMDNNHRPNPSLVGR